MKPNIDSLIIEVTRRCILKCEHCLRGAAQKQDMDTKHVDALFKEVGFISTITFTGGEPALVPGILRDILELAKKHKVSIGDFYIATSTVVPDENTWKDFLVVCLEWYLYCDNNDISAVNWSNDTYHELNNRNVKLLSTLRFAEPKYSGKFNPAVINEGRAFTSGIGSRENTIDSIILEEYDDIVDIREADIYLNCDGMIINGCNWSYQTQARSKNLQICKVENFGIGAVKAYIEEMEKGA